MVIIGVGTVLYANKVNNVTAPAPKIESVPVVENAPDATDATTTTSLRSEAKIEIAGALSDIDSDLAEIAIDEGSKDDTIDF